MRTITDLVRPGVRRQQARAARAPWQQMLIRWGWFVALWCAGVAGTALLALPFKLIIATAK
ncbi:hypothetical protein PCA31118_00190 [Pandoraea captiosa]|jgi:hypothetical protein|uniref:DUF2474 domain-containing protein n=1 Tax=Pandoraea captiosa TaxID=2508302 RepID=A0A5E4ZIT9_9BURK|nr:hypothetical protein [Pandoraea captiosa]VVE60305.1 hypothetical protein PCA31118_00190 [Pandoraea captiosa]